MLERFLFVFVLAGFTIPPAHSATFSTVVKVDGTTCENSSTVDIGNMSQCAGELITATTNPAITTYDVNARADLGSVGVSGSMATLGDSTNFLSATASFSDTLFFGIESGVFSFSVDVAGSQDFSLPESVANSNTVAQLSIDTYIVEGTSAVVPIYSQVVLSRPWAGFLDITSEGQLGTSLFSFDFSGGQLSLSAVMSAQIRCRSGLSDQTCSASSDFLNSLRFTGGSVFDEFGNAVSTAFSSSSGFDYLTGLDSHGDQNDPSIVPVPVPGLLLLSSLGVLAGMRRRSRRF